MSIAIWTDSNERVTRKHYDESQVDTTDAFVVDSEGVPPSTEDWVSVTEHYNDTDGFYYTTSDPFAGLNLTTSEKQDLYKACTDRDIEMARTVVENILSG